VIPSSEITPKSLYLNRRQFMKLAGSAGAAALLAACGVSPTEQPPAVEPGVTGFEDELGDPANTFEEITNYNNYYEFTTDKAGVATLAEGFPTSPWQVEVGGLVQNPKVYDIDDLRAFPQEERIYRLRCVEAWSLVIPWTGFPLASLLAEVEPMTSAKYVAFTTKLDEENMPGLRMPFYPWPYTEGLRLDEAMNDLALLVTGLYGETLPPQDGAPIRLAVPWKYGFKSIKSIVKIDLVEERPATLWNTVAPNEYGFYANVNPLVNHPRWSQATERRIGETKRRETLPFNGYLEQVQSLYEGMSLISNY
ncbi:MAG TPA: protein-methionine-sulfoxide reductase catalytic subunit MsrP, partial [Bellilinea sp.]|nr:protein-methionine-sulfoxide reductase catalytic subunit MsrP [Bellilinea sp.]